MNDQQLNPKKVFFLRRLLRPAPKPPRITNKKVIDKRYRYWRIRTLYSMYIGYAVFYFTRKSFTFAMPVMLKTLPLTKADLGIISTSFYVIYGVSKFISGMLSDRSNPRYFMAFGLIVTGITNLLFGLSSSMLLLTCFWCVNAFFQGWGWPPCARLLTHWYSQTERGRWWSVWNTSHNVGGALIPLLIAAILYYCHHWQWAIIIPGMIAIIIGMLLINRLRGVPTSLGLPTIEHYRQDNGAVSSIDESPQQPILDIFRQYVLKNKYIWLLALSYSLIYVIRTAMNDWGAVYLTENGASIMRADTAMAFFEVGGFFGSLAAGWLSDIYFSGTRGPVNVIYSGLCLLALLGFWWHPANSLAISAGLIFVIGFLVFGPQMLIGMSAAELIHKDAAGTSTGFVGLFGYLGAALSGWPISLIIQHYHWPGFFATLIICSLLSVGLLVPLYQVRGCSQTLKR